MLQLRAFVDGETADRILPTLMRAPGVRHVERVDPAAPGLATAITADVPADEADAALDVLARSGVSADDVYLVRFDPVSPLEHRTLPWLRRHGDTFSWAELLGFARVNAQPIVRYLVAMGAAGSIAAVGVATANQILIVGAMAVSPDLLPVSALCVALAAAQGRLALRAFVTLVAGLALAGIAAAATAAVLYATGFLDHRLGSGGLGTLTTADVTTVIVALAAGIAGMLAFETRSAAAVGVAISVTTIPAVAYFAVAAVIGQGSDAWGAFVVLDVNVVTLLAAGTCTVWIQRWFRSRHERRPAQ